jgi:hypothetical protein
MHLNIAIIAAILTHGSSLAAPEEIRVDRASLHTECKLPDGRPCVLSVEITPHSAASGQPAFDYGGDSKTYQPHRVIESISISIAGRSVFVPAPAYTDLGDPSLCAPEVLRDGRNLILRIYGGNAGWSSYYADLFIRGTAVFERRVTNNQEATVAGKNYKPDVKTFK